MRFKGFGVVGEHGGGQPEQGEIIWREFDSGRTVESFIDF